MSKKKFNKKPEEKPLVSVPKAAKTTMTVHPTDPDKKIRRNFHFLIFIVSFMLYGNTIPNEFAMDDELVTLDHPLVSKGISAIPEIFATRYVQNEMQSYEYRPIVLVSYAIEHQFTSGNPHFSHFINILLYALTGVLLFQILSILFLNFHWILPASITLFFLIHPIHSEVVASLKNRDELLSFLFTLLSIRSVLRYYDHKHYKYLIYSLLFFILAILSKKTAAPLVFTLPLILYFFKDLPLKKALLFFIVPLVLIFIVNFIVQSNLETVNRPGMYFENPFYVDKPSFFEKLPMAFYSMGYYIRLLFIPYPLLIYYGYSHVEIVGWDNIWTIVSALVFLGGGIYCLLNLSKKNILIFGFLYFTYNIVLFYNLLPTPGIIADRFAYGASLGFSIFVCLLVFKALKVDLDKNAKLKIPTGLTYGFIGLFLVCNIYVFQRNKDWKDHLTIYLADAEKAPDSAKIHALIGGYCMQTMERSRTGKLKKPLTQEEYARYIQLSETHFKEALRVYPDYVACLNNLGTLNYSYKGEMDSSAMYFESVLKLEPNHVQANFNLGSYNEIKFGALVLMEKYFSSMNIQDSISSSITMGDDAKMERYIQSIVKYFRLSNLAYSDLTKTFQQFIDDSRNSNGNVNRANYINAINNYWSGLMMKVKLDPSQVKMPGEDFLQVIVNSRTNHQNEFSKMLQAEVHSKLITELTPLIKEGFQAEFSREPDSSDYRKLTYHSGLEKEKAAQKMIKMFDNALFSGKMYAPAYQKLSQIYSGRQLWDSLLHLNQKVLKAEEATRLTDVYRMMGTAYFYSKRETEGIKYFEMSISEEEKILNKVAVTLKHQSAVGNSIAVQRMNQFLINTKNNLYSLNMNLGAMHNSMGNEAKANEYLLKAKNYQQ